MSFTELKGVSDSFRLPAERKKQAALQTPSLRLILVKKLPEAVQHLNVEVALFFMELKVCVRILQNALSILI